MTVLSAAAAVAMAGVLLWAGLEKARDLGPVAATLRQLGLRGAASRPLAASVATAEVGVALALLFRPDSGWTQGGVVALALAFAAAGALALGRGEPIHCACFGGRGGKLGLGQVVALVPWLAAAALLALAAEPPSAVAGAGRLAAVGLALASWRAVAVWDAWREARGDRLSAEEMYVWLH